MSLFYSQVLSTRRKFLSLPLPEKPVSPIIWPTDMEVRTPLKYSVSMPVGGSHWASNVLIAYMVSWVHADTRMGNVNTVFVSVMPSPISQR